MKPSCAALRGSLLGTGMLVLAACGPAAEGAPRASAQPAAAPVELSIYAAASTRDALQELQSRYAKSHGYVTLVFNFGSSGDLSRQILAANKADVFLSADEKEMDRVAAGGLVLPDTRQALLSNQLVVIEPVDPAATTGSMFSTPFEAGQLADPRIERLSLANVETVPAGRYAKQWLEAQSQWSAVEARVLPATDVRAALAAVESGGAQAGIVYRTDAARSKQVRIVHAVPLAEGPAISYPLAVLAERPHMADAKAFADFLGSPDARQVFELHGFISLDAVSPAGK